MLHYKRKIYLQSRIKRFFTNLLFFISIVGVIVSSAFLFFIYKPYKGVDIGIDPYTFIVSLLLSIALIIILYKAPSNIPIAKYLQTKEKKAFLKKYNPPANITSKSGAIKYIYLACMFASTALPILAVFLTRKMNENVVKTSIWISFLLLFIIFYHFVRKLRRLTRGEFIPLINWINKKLPNTKIEYLLPDMSVSPVSVSFDHELTGDFKGRKFNFKYDLTGMTLTHLSSKMNRMHTKGSIIATITSKTVRDNDVLIEITERDHNWKSIEGENTDICFEKRFITVVKDMKLISEKIKSKCLENDRSLNLSYKNNSLTYSTDDLSIFPAYSVHGQILFLDFLYEILEELDAIK